MEEKIKAFLEQYFENNPGRKADERFVDGIKANAISFQRLADNLSYEMKLNITEEGTLVVQFSSADQVYTTYTFYNAVVAAP